MKYIVEPYTDQPSPRPTMAVDEWIRQQLLSGDQEQQFENIARSVSVLVEKLHAKGVLKDGDCCQICGSGAHFFALP